MIDYVNLTSQTGIQVMIENGITWVPLVKKVNAYSDKIDVWQLAVYILEDKKKLIETDNSRFYVKLTKKGTVDCGKRIEIT